MNITEYMEYVPKIQKIQLEILQDFHNFCVEHKLTYSLAWGSLLGAIRHKGFIPWDDDIDLVMPREDYQKFLELRNEFNSHHDYFTQNYLIDNSFFAFTKIRKNNTTMKMRSSLNDEFHQGIWINVFPLDQMPARDSKMFYFQKTKIGLLVIAVTSNSYDKVKSARNFLNKFMRLFFFSLNKLLGRNLFINLLEKNLRKNHGEESTLYACTEMTVGSSNPLYPFLVKDFKNAKLTEFEGKMFYVVDNAEEYLNISYGNYLELPNVEDRFPHHNVKVLSFSDDE